MASVAICPHCYLQLVVPDGVESDELVECPTCAKEFGLDQAVLRAIPEVVRHSRAAAASVASAEAAPAELAIEIADVAAEVVDADEAAIEVDGEREAAVIEQIKARIEAEIATNGLPPGTSTMLPLEELPAEESTESPPAAEQVDEDLASWFRHAETVPELLLNGDREEVGDDMQQPVAEHPWPAADDAAEIVESNEIVESKIEQRLEPVESDATPEDISAEIDELPGPSFDLPNVPLIPTNGATVEFDVSMSFGPAAETEFELDDVDFASMPAEEPVAEEAVEAYEPVFSEPEATAVSAAPVVLPGIPRARRKKRSVVRTLVGTALGGVVGLSFGYAILLYVLGPEGDLLHVAQYIPSAVLPNSFGNNSTQIAAAVTSPTNTDTAESANVPAGYTEEANAPAESTATYESTGDDRYGTEPSPLEEPAAEPIAAASPNTTIEPLPIRGPTFTVDQLATALEAGKDAQAGLVTGDLSDASVRRTKGMSYAKLCDLAEALTFVDRSSPSVESEQATEGADRLFRETLADAHTRNEIDRIAQIWIDSPHRRHGGVFLAGTLSSGQIAGDVYEYELDTDDGGKLTLLMQEPLDPLLDGSGQPVGIVGSIVDNPTEQVAGYNGTAKRAIWVARAIPLD